MPEKESFFKKLGKAPKEEGPELINPVNPRHLKEGVSPIRACIGTPEQFKNKPGAEKAAFDDEAQNLSGTHNVDYYGEPEDLTNKKFKHDDDYVLSPVDNLDKFSKSFLNCTGIIVTGQDKETGKNVSFLSHQTPQCFLTNKDKRNRFTHNLKQRLVEIKKRSVKGTIDAVIIGGNYSEKWVRYQEDYLRSVKLLSAEAQKILGFEPLVMTGPKTLGGKDNVFYDNKGRRLYIMRPEVGDGTTESYSPNNIEKQKEKWK